MTDPELGPEAIQGAEAISFIAERVQRWSFEHQSPDDSVYFAYHVARWIYDTFGESNITYNIGEFDGAELPTSLQLLITRTWKDETFLGDENRLRIYNEPDFEYIPPVIPKWDEMYPNNLTYAQMMERITADPEILENIQLGSFYTFDQLRVSFEPRHYNRWGLDFRVSPKDVSAAAFGEQGKTAKPTNYLLTYHNNPAALAKTTAELAVLAAKHSDFASRTTLSPAVIDEFDRRLLGLIPIKADLSKFDLPGGVKELVIRHLIEQGRIEGPKNEL